MKLANFRGVEVCRNHSLIQEIRQALSSGEEFEVGGLYQSIAPFMLGQMTEDLKRPVFIILQDEDDLESTLLELKLWTQTRDIFPYPFVHKNITTLEHAALLQQMKSIRALLEPEADRGIWVSSLRALESMCFSLDFVDEPVVNFEIGQSFKHDELLTLLESRGFNCEDKVDQKGDFAMRGGILDIFPRFSNHPIRIEFFGNEIETIREFSAVTQKSIRALSRFVLDDMDYQKITHIERDGSILDYIPKDSLFFLQEPELLKRDVEAKNMMHSGLSELLLQDHAEERKKRGITRIDFGRKFESSRFEINAQILENKAYSINDAIDFIQKSHTGEQVFLVEDFGSNLKLAERGKLDVWNLEGSLENNFAIPELKVFVYHSQNLIQISDIGDEDPKDTAMADFMELEMGDYVVHESYGVGQFLGLTSLEKKGVMSDFLLLQFSGSSKVYVPIAQLHLVQKYIGQGDGAPELSKLGSKSWEMKKKKARKAIDKIVMELVQRQAFRKELVGHSFSADSKEQRSFERAFAYQDTPCQTQATLKIKKDMEDRKPMDHLLCGDVGFGKTEVAMRVAHKAMLDGKQVAILAPTTVLAEQHYHNFCERFKEKAIHVAVLDRFRSQKQNQDTLRQLSSGVISVLIGTHRLLSRDVEFKDLGLLILDEEQRFGVKQKEALKKKYPSVDVLSLSATPIPRSLHMSMLGIRGISNLTIPPENRHAIRTYIREYDKGIIKHAIQRELDRGGQSYFLHNRVEDIFDMKDRLQEMFPSARIGVGHGQMPENKLSNVMQAFYKLEIDIFLSTSIIANGIDIPTANTMIINQAHLFGLSELHQIRGRIGRYSIQAYCYLLLPPGSKLPQKSLRRLRAVEEHQELGAGFKLAMRDMEIRGVGNILGEDQHGQIADIGYELYTQYLSQAIAEMKGESPKYFQETELQWSVGSTYFPKDFLPSHSDRIDFYRRISFAKNVDTLEKIQSELRDRFGILPKPTLQMIRLFKCKTRLRDLDIKSLKKKQQGDTALLEPLHWSDELKLSWVLDHQNKLAFTKESHLILKLDQIWDDLCNEKVEKDPYMKYSYYNEDNRPEPLDVLEMVIEFISTSKEKTIQKMDTAKA